MRDVGHALNWRPANQAPPFLGPAGEALTTTYLRGKPRSMKGLVSEESPLMSTWNLRSPGEVSWSINILSAWADSVTWLGASTGLTEEWIGHPPLKVAGVDQTSEHKPCIPECCQSNNSSRGVCGVPTFDFEASMSPDNNGSSHGHSSCLDRHAS